jgi:alpha-glucosidase
LLYVRKDELHTGFNFPYLTANWNAKTFRETIATSLASNGSVGAPTTWVLENHDVWRAVTKYAPIIGAEEMATDLGIMDIHATSHWDKPRDIETGLLRARAGMLLMLALPGSAYIYQGQELGLDEVFDIPSAARQDPGFKNTGGKVIGRDGCRVPLPWNDSSASFGFGSNDNAWLPQPARWADKTVDKQGQDAHSMLTLTRTALKLRRELPALGGISQDIEPLIWHDEEPEMICFSRPARLGGAEVWVAVNMGSRAIRVSGIKNIVLASSPDAFQTDELLPNSCIWFTK